VQVRGRGDEHRRSTGELHEVAVQGIARLGDDDLVARVDDGEDRGCECCAGAVGDELSCHRGSSPACACTGVSVYGVTPRDHHPRPAGDFIPAGERTGLLCTHALGSEGIVRVVAAAVWVRSADDPAPDLSSSVCWVDSGLPVASQFA